MSTTKSLNNGSLIHKYGFEKILIDLKENFKEYIDNYLKIKSINSVMNGIIRFDFNVINEEMKESIKNIESNLSQKLQKDLFEVYTTTFEKSLLSYCEKELYILKEELENKNPNIEYNVFVSHVSTFHYFKNTGILRLEILL